MPLALSRETAPVAALHWLRDRQTLALALVGLIELAKIAEIPIELGLEDCFAGYLPKPEAMIDDQRFQAWRSLRHVYPFQSDMFAQ